MASLIDWDLAARSAKNLTPPPPHVSRAEADETVAELYRDAGLAAAHVAELTALIEPPVTALTRVVDRAGWIDVNAAGLRTVMAPLVDRLAADNKIGRVAETVGGRLTGMQAGAVLGFLSGKVLGQFEFFDRPAGQLLLVAPNLVTVERQLGVDPQDFRLWVCLHEVTHRVQFTANPWLSGYMSQALGVLTKESSDDVARVVGRLADFARGRGESASDDPHSRGILGLLRAVQSEPQREALDQMLVLGTLLEGHADHVMDAVGPVVIPSVTTIRSRFDERRHRKQPPLQRLLRALLGIDAKLSQYTRGKAFVDHVVNRVGMERFNTVWTGADTLPRPIEIEYPQRWIDRVL